ncbi:hypothetical protein FBU59_001786 [Linderina macrospora]|uniref:Uncharacterized protein n=1 Tax=Linderina macrospora TaxID=4868 RepID=A0ACC1JCT2_9FUNG|nr:hypothetical protein FBU59_001786 [Linderina macrospora]
MVKRTASENWDPVVEKEEEDVVKEDIVKEDIVEEETVKEDIVEEETVEEETVKEDVVKEEVVEEGLVENSESGAESDEEDVYVVERIVKHTDGEDGRPLYWIKWEGYDGPADNTWESEDNIIDKSILKRYWDEYNAKAAKKATPAKKRGRPPTRGVSSPAKTNGGAAKRRRTSAKKDEEPETSEDPSKDTRYGDDGPEADDWVPLLDRIITLDTTDAGTVAHIKWKNGQECEYPLEVMYAKLPQQMLQFYESRLRFRPAK